MAREHCQAGCRRCQKATLHFRDLDETPHILYAILSIFCFIMFLPVWLFHFIMVSYGNSRKLWLCSVCGEPWVSGPIQSPLQAQPPPISGPR